MKYKAILFDADDTLFKTSAAKWAQHKYVAKKYYNIDLTDEKLAEHWGRPFDELTALLYDNLDTTEGRAANFACHELEFPKQIFKDTLPTITKLYEAGVKLGMVSSMRWDIAKIEIEVLKIPLNYFTVVQGSDATQYHKPDPRVFDPAKKTLAKHGVTDDILYVGDALSDFYAARDAGFEFIGITTGFVNAQQFGEAGVDKVMRTLSELIAHVGV